MDKEQEVRLQFLDEAEEYLEQIETGVMGLSDPSQRDPQILDGILRAAHSTKGGAAMMGYHTLSDLAHRLEDFFKVIKATKAQKVDAEIEHLLLQSVDGLRHCLKYYFQGIIDIPANWLEEQINPLFAQLHQLIGDPQPEDSFSSVDGDNSEDMIALLFESEVEECLTRLENVLNSADKTCLKEEFSLAAQELAGLGEMLALDAFTALSNSIHSHLETHTESSLEAIAAKALQTWRRSQALILVGQSDNLPQEISLEFELKLEVIDNNLDEYLREEDYQVEDISVISYVDSALPEELTTQADFQRLDLEETGFEEQNFEKSQKPEKSADEIVRVSAKKLEQMSDLVGELTIEKNGLNLQVKNLHDLLYLLIKRIKILNENNTRLRTLYDQNSSNLFADKSEFSPLIRKEQEHNLLLDFASIGTGLDQLEMDNYSDIHLVFQSLMETIVQIEEVSEDININLQKQEQTSRNLTRTSQLLQTQVTSVRMRPFSDLTARLKRGVREMSLKYNKDVELNVIGADTPLEKTVLESLNEPLLHLLRNAFDHGIEDEKIRISQGKSATGTINITASHRGNQTVISIADDGAGINIEKIRNKALNLGFKSEDLAKKTNRDLLKLIFEPGFSTAEKVTDLSGRGVGMDIVRTKIRACQGDILVDTKPGVGTTFTLIMPFSLSVVRVLLVESGGILLAIPSSIVEEMIITESEMRVNREGQEYYQWDDDMIRLVKLNQWLHFARPFTKPYTEAIPVINQPVVLMIGEQSGDFVGLEVESYWGEQEVTLREIEGSLKLPTGFTGCTILGDGRVVPLVDPWALLQSSQQDWMTKGREINNDNSLTELTFFFEKSTPTIMIVDDSINVRRFLALTLEKAGYKVQQAKDGQEALDTLKKGISVTAIICDIEMPRLDGYGFLANVKSDPNLKALPVIMLTSRSGEKHRKIAMNLGAKAYLSKPFQEKELLELLKSISAVSNLKNFQNYISV